jgi:hypothetical protein
MYTAFILKKKLFFKQIQFMGFYKYIRTCGCIEITTTLTIPPSTYIQHTCDACKKKKTNKADDGTQAETNTLD